MADRDEWGYDCGIKCSGMLLIFAVVVMLAAVSIRRARKR